MKNLLIGALALVGAAAIDLSDIYPAYNFSVPVDHFHNESRYEPHSNESYNLRQRTLAPGTKTSVSISTAGFTAFIACVLGMPIVSKRVDEEAINNHSKNAIDSLERMGREYLDNV